MCGRYERQWCETTIGGEAVAGKKEMTGEIFSLAGGGRDNPACGSTGATLRPEGRAKGV